MSAEHSAQKDLLRRRARRTRWRARVEVGASFVLAPTSMFAAAAELGAGDHPLKAVAIFCAGEGLAAVLAYRGIRDSNAATKLEWQSGIKKPRESVPVPDLRE